MLSSLPVLWAKRASNAKRAKSTDHLWKWAERTEYDAAKRDDEYDAAMRNDEYDAAMRNDERQEKLDWSTIFVKT